MIKVPIGACLPLTGGTLTGQLTIQNKGSGNPQMLFNMDRSWLFKQGGESSGTFLMLKPETANKHFQICSNDEQNGCTFYMADSTDVAYFGPLVNGGMRLGSPSFKWGLIYSTSSAIQTSDRKQKENIKQLSDKYEKLFDELKPVSFKFKDTDTVSHDRLHLGFISQDVEESLSNVGLTPLDFAGFCKDKRQEIVGYTKDENEVPIYEDVLDDKGNPQYDYSLRYSEFIALNTHMIQKLMKRVDELEKEVITLKS